MRRKLIKNNPVTAITIFLPTGEVKKYDHFISMISVFSQASYMPGFFNELSYLKATDERLFSTNFSTTMEKLVKKVAAKVSPIVKKMVRH